LGKELSQWSPCGVCNTLSIVSELPIICHAIIPGFSSSGSHIYLWWLQKESQASFKVMVYFDLWCWTECSMSKRCTDRRTRVLFWAANSFWEAHLQCVSLYLFSFTKWYRTFIIGINIHLTNCQIDAKGFLSNHWRTILLIHLDCSISGSCEVASEEPAKLCFPKHWVTVE
jgi:hypothetical protein